VAARFPQLNNNSMIVPSVESPASSQHHRVNPDTLTVLLQQPQNQSSNNASDTPAVLHRQEHTSTTQLRSIDMGEGLNHVEKRMDAARALLLLT